MIAWCYSSKLCYKAICWDYSRYDYSSCSALSRSCRNEKPLTRFVKETFISSVGKHSTRGSIVWIYNLVIRSLTFCQKISIKSNSSSQSSRFIFSKRWLTFSWILMLTALGLRESYLFELEKRFGEYLLRPFSLVSLKYKSFSRRSKRSFPISPNDYYIISPDKYGKITSRASDLILCASH